MDGPLIRDCFGVAGGQQHGTDKAEDNDGKFHLGGSGWSGVYEVC